jgi:hypothetical protein
VCTRLIIFIAPKHENFRDTPGRPLVSKKRGKNLWLPSGYHWYRPTWGTTCRPEPEQAVERLEYVLRERRLPRMWVN